MPIRRVKLRLKEVIDAHEAYKDEPQERMAALLDIAPNTYSKYLRNEALTYERRVLARACDVLNVQIEDLIELMDVDFFSRTGRVQFLRNRPQVDREDKTAEANVTNLFNQDIPSVHFEDATELAREIYYNDCVILGSPRNNMAGEIALSVLFGIDPFDESDANRRRLPLLMESPREWHASSPLVKVVERSGKAPWRYQVAVAETGAKIGAGNDRAFQTKQSRATADYFPESQFPKTAIAKAQDYGVILVADHWIDDRSTPVRTYWLSGFSSVGTYASTRAIEKEIREFSMETELQEDTHGRFVLAIVDASFRMEVQPHRRIPEDRAKIVHLIRGSLPSKVMLPRRYSDAGAAAHPHKEIENNSRLNSVLEVCKIVLRKSFDKHQSTLISLYGSSMDKFAEEIFERKLAEFQRSVAGTPRGTEERRAEGSENNDFLKLKSFLNKLFLNSNPEE